MVCVNYTMKYLYLLIVATFFFCAANAQGKCVVLKAGAYYTVQQPGNIAVDENGRKRKASPAKERIIYIATSCTNTPVISLLKYGSVAAKAAIENIAGNEVALANDEGKSIYFKAPKGAHIWKISVEQNDEIATEEGKPNIYLKMLVNKRTQVIRIYSEALLPSPDRP